MFWCRTQVAREQDIAGSGRLVDGVACFEGTEHAHEETALGCAWLDDGSEPCRRRCRRWLSVDDGWVDDAFELPAEVEGARWQQLGHHHGGEVFGWVDPEDGGGSATPHELAG